jgi:hypothetical protein
MLDHFVSYTRSNFESRLIPVLGYVTWRTHMADRITKGTLFSHPQETEFYCIVHVENVTNYPHPFGLDWTSLLLSKLRLLPTDQGN